MTHIVTLTTTITPASAVVNSDSPATVIDFGVAARVALTAAIDGARRLGDLHHAKALLAVRAHLDATIGEGRPHG